MIRNSTEDDCEAIARVHVASWQSTYRGQIPEEFLNALSVPTRTELWKRLLTKEGYRVFVLEQSGEINGFVSFGPSLDRDAPANQGEVYAIYLLAKAQGSGAGKALWDAAVSELRVLGFLCITLWAVSYTHLTLPTKA